MGLRKKDYSNPKDKVVIMKARSKKVEKQRRNAVSRKSMKKSDLRKKSSHKSQNVRKNKVTNGKSFKRTRMNAKGRVKCQREKPLKKPTSQVRTSRRTQNHKIGMAKIFDHLVADVYTVGHSTMVNPSTKPETLAYKIGEVSNMLDALDKAKARLSRARQYMVDIQVDAQKNDVRRRRRAEKFLERRNNQRNEAEVFRISKDDYMNF